MKTRYFSSLVLFLLFMMFTAVSYATRYSVDVREFEFSPSNLTSVKIGDTIHWEWKNGSHTTPSTTIPAGATTWDSPLNASHLTYDYIPTVIGVYHYKCTFHESMGMVGQFTVLNDVGIQKNVFVPKISIYPNPFKDRINFTSTPQDGIFVQHLTIYNAGGKILRESSFVDGKTFPEYLDLSDIPEGLILFEFIDNLNRTYVLKAVRKE
jgi:plastocyanin